MARKTGSSQRPDNSVIDELTKANEALEARNHKLKEFAKGLIEQKRLLMDAGNVLTMKNRGLEENSFDMEQALQNLTTDEILNKVNFENELKAVWAEKAALQGTIERLQAGRAEASTQNNVQVTEDAKSMAESVLRTELEKVIKEHNEIENLNDTRLADCAKQIQHLLDDNNKLKKQVQDAATAQSQSTFHIQARASEMAILRHDYNQSLKINKELSDRNDQLAIHVNKTHDEIVLHLQKKRMQDAEIEAYANECLRLRVQGAQLGQEKAELIKILASQLGGPPYTGRYNPFPVVPSPAFSPLGPLGAGDNIWGWWRRRNGSVVSTRMVNRVFMIYEAQTS